MKNTVKKAATSIAVLTLAAVSLFSTATMASAKTVKTNSNSPYYKIVMKNKTTNHTYKLKAQNDKERYDTIKADFTNLPVGSYKVGVYKCNPETHNKVLKAKTSWSAESFKDAKYDVTTYFYMVPKKIEVDTTWITSKHLNIAKLDSKYKAVAQNKTTGEFFEQNLSVNFNQYDAFKTSIDGLTSGKYSINVYKLNSAGHKTAKVSHSTYDGTVNKGLVTKVDINYFPVAEKVKATTYSVHKDSSKYQIVMTNLTTGKVYDKKARNDWNKYDTDYALLKNVPSGKYNITVFTRNSHEMVCSKVAEKDLTIHTNNANIKISYYDVPKLIEAHLYQLSK